MTDRDSSVSEDELHAYVDGELPADRREAVAAWLAEHPEQAALVAAWRAQAESIRARFDSVADEPVPDRLKIDNLLRATRASRRSWTAVAAAAGLAAFLVGGAAGWIARGATAGSPPGFDMFTAEALDAYKLYVVEVRHPVEVPGTDRAHMTQWLSKRVGYEQSIPDLKDLGLSLVGGRLLPGPTGAAAFYMYESASGDRYTIYCAKARMPETSLRYKGGDRYAAFYWVDDKVAYVVSGPAEREKLETVSKAIYDQIDKTTKKS
ncbi:MAG TPA: anti-sigma factor [Pseudolabrys sp.]|jgi:anti-sigma factor RsiW|nr:anti-sigma factor [Pseudolabrys sp.]